jgi:phospholipid transport system substrate-binding protein
MPLPVATADTTAASPAVTGAIAQLNPDLLAQMKAGRAPYPLPRAMHGSPPIERVFDLPVVLRATVGLRWAELAQVDQTQLLDASRSYTISSYVFLICGEFRRLSQSALRHSAGQAERRREGGGGDADCAVVRDAVRIDYVLRPEEGESGVLWKASDIMLDGSISQVAVRRSEFYCLLGDGGARN